MISSILNSYSLVLSMLLLCRANLKPSGLKGSAVSRLLDDGDCSPGCSYSEMANGNCPTACTDSCFQYCSQAYCSPGCAYSDMQYGFCSSCSDICENTCLNRFCDQTCRNGKCFKGCPAMCCVSRTYHNDGHDHSFIIIILVVPISISCIV
jgi:hypothetical protein